MGFLSSLLDRIFNTKTQNIGKVVTKEGDNEISGTEDNDRLVIWGSVISEGTGVNTIETGEGKDRLTILGKVESDNLNQITLGEGGNTLKIGGGLIAGVNGTNTITGSDDGDKITISGKVESENLNEIIAGSGNNTISLTKGLSSIGDGVNTVQAGAGDDKITVLRSMYSENENSINAGDGDNDITIKKGMEAVDGGKNYVLTGDGDDDVTICGDVIAKDGGVNEVSTGGGDDLISLHGVIGVDALTIDAGDGYDKLVLNAARVDTFNKNYQDWLEGYDDLSSMNVEVIEVDLSKTKDLGKIEWLGKLGEEAGIDIQLNLDGSGRNLKLGDFFSAEQDDIFTSLNLGGSHKNTLTIDGSLNANGLDADNLTILGNGKDSVKLSGEWEAVGDKFVDADSGITFQEYQFANDSVTETLLLQAEISVISM